MLFASRILLGALCTLAARGIASQQPGATPSTRGATVSGVVRDSVARAPLAGAWVQLVAADGQGAAARAVVSDSLGHFAIAEVPDGRYTLGFFHPMLDSLGVEPTLHEVTVRRGRAVRADLATPSSARLYAAICGARTATAEGPAGGVVVGVVRDARGRASVGGATVTGEWLEISFLPGGLIDRRRPRVVATTGPNGWFALCNVPSGGTMFIGAGRGDENTDLIEIQVPVEGFLRRELFVGASRVVVVGDTTRADTLAPAPRRLRVGEARLQGTVVTVVGERPLAGAIARLSDGPSSRADDRGAWTIANAPAGTRTLEVRAVGFYPVRRAVDVLDGAAPLHLALSTFQAVLDTVKILAAGTPDRHQSGFEERSRTGLGRFLTAADLERRGVIETSDVFKNLPGVRTEYDSTGTLQIMMRSSFGGYCAPSFYVDGLHLFTLAADELDNIVRAKNVRAIEVYTDATVPPQFQQAMSGCGAIVIWSK